MHKLSFSYRSIDRSLKAQISHSFQGMFVSVSHNCMNTSSWELDLPRRVLRRLHRCTRVSEKLLVHHGARTTCEGTWFFRTLLLTLYCPVFTLYIMRFTVQKFYVLPTQCYFCMCLCVLFFFWWFSENKQRAFSMRSGLIGFFLPVWRIRVAR